jgi:hypothetical protein
MIEQVIKDGLSYNPITGLFFRTKGTGGQPAGSLAGKVNELGYRVIGVKGKILKAHRIAWYVFYGKWPDGVIDHINGKPDDNRICNLRDVTQGQNMENQKKARSNSTTKRLGVYHSGSKFIAKIQSKGKQTYLGTFNTADEAEQAYKKAKAELHIADGYCYPWECE